MTTCGNVAQQLYMMQLVSVRLGEYDLETDVDCVNTPQYKTCSEPPIDVAVVEKIAHEYYNPFDPNQSNDIALLRLARDVPYTEFIKPICLPVYPNLLKQTFAGTNATVAGWGKTSETGTDSSVKMKVTLPVQSNRDCENVYGGTRVSLSKLQVCAGGVNGKDSCRGDSGGPLMSLYTAPGEINWYVMGVVSFGPAKCGLNGWPGIYTRVTEYIPWILKNMRP
ncbi:hypothetical protein PPYR_06339 [Photinus pyralis]|uniref:Peptidase S1 domain-containing protein n=1 Tax=Photinus pyralis TaxID=7054 RepID=A0A5N4ATG1_PHOPY|nr:hypothetical protein PPYR_06339 [Photinus pyralis]